MKQAKSATVRMIWVCIGTLSLVIGIIGIFLPLLPTTPFLLITAYCYSRGSPRLHAWLLSHPTFGPSIRDWNEHRIIRREVKWFVTATVGVSASVPLFILQGIPLWARLCAGLCSAAVIVFIWCQRSEKAE